MRSPRRGHARACGGWGVRSAVRLAALLGLVGFSVGAAACSSNSGSGRATTALPAPVVQGTILKVADFPAAVAAVVVERGEPQQLVEVNATPDGVNVFVPAGATNEVAYFYANGQLQAPGAPVPISSAPFDPAGIDLGLGATLVRRTQEQFPGATVVSVALLQLPDQGVRWALRSRSARGGLLNALYTTAGELVSVTPASDPAG